MPWPMSEGIQLKQNQVEIIVSNEPSSSLLAASNSIPSIEGAASSTTTPAPGGQLLAQSPAGALLLGVSGNSLPQDPPPSVASDTFVREYCQFLVRTRCAVGMG